MEQSTTIHLAAAAAFSAVLATLTAGVWIYMLRLACREPSSRRQLLIALLLIPLVAGIVHLVGVNHGFTWGEVVGPLRDARRETTPVRVGLVVVYGFGEAAFLCTIAALMLILPGVGLQFLWSDLQRAMRAWRLKTRR